MQNKCNKSLQLITQLYWYKRVIKQQFKILIENEQNRRTAVCL